MLISIYGGGPEIRKNYMIDRTTSSIVELYHKPVDMLLLGNRREMTAENIDKWNLLERSFREIRDWMISKKVSTSFEECYYRCW